MAGNLRGYAIGINEVRDIFGADPNLASWLFALAAEAFHPPPDPEQGLFGKLGPLFRTSRSKTIVDPALPNRDDAEGLLTGRYCPPARTAAAWQIMHVWLARLAFGTVSRELDQTDFEDLEFELAKAGLASPYAIGKLLGNDAQLPLQPPSGASVGYAKYQHVIATHEALAEAVDSVADQYRGAVTPFVDFLGCFRGWADSAASSGRPAPDLFIVWTRG